MANKINKVVLAYSGGLDTTVIVRWLQNEYDCEVITYTADLGQGEELEPAKQRAQSLGVQQIFIDDLREEFVADYVFPMFRANCLYEGEYLLGTSIARPLIAKKLVDIAHRCQADAVSHGATGKGNDQVRFELGIYALDPRLEVVAPWRQWNLNSRQSLLDFCRDNDIPFEQKGNKPPYSIDANLLHTSYEGGILERIDQAPEESMWQRTRSIANADDQPQDIVIDFHQGDPVAIDGQQLTPANMLDSLNQLGGKHGIGRADIVENRYVGMKSRGCYETPGGSILLKAHRAMESATLDRELTHLKDSLMPRYATLIYNGYWWSPERVALQKLIDYSQHYVEGRVHLTLYKGNVTVTGRESNHSLFDENIATFENDQGSYNQQDAEGFIKLHALRLKIAANKNRKLVID